MFSSVFPDTVETEKKHLNQAKQPQGLRLQVANWLNLIGLYLYCMSIGPSTAGVNLALALLLCASLLASDKLWTDLRSFPVFWISLALAAYITLQSYFCIQAHPTLGQAGNPHWTHYLLISGAPSLIIAWWMVRHRKHIPALLMLTLLGLLAEFAIEADWAQFWGSALSTRDFWGTPENQVGYLSALGLCACALIGCRFFLRNSASSKTTWLFPFLLAIAGMCFAVVSYGAQSRTSWIAVTITLFIFLGYEFFHALFKKYAVKRSLLCLVILTMSASIFPLANPSNNLKQRLSGTPEAISSLVSFEPSKVWEASPSLGKRCYIWISGWNAFKERPLFGWGAGGIRILDEIKVNNFTLLEDGHFHNIYIDTLFSFGIIGAILFITVYIYIIKYNLQFIGRTNILNGFATLPLAWMLVTLIIWLAQVRIGHTGGRSAVLLTLALLLAPAIWNNLQTLKSPE